MEKSKKTKDPKEVFKVILRPKCFGATLICQHPCDHAKDCEQEFNDKLWLSQAIEKEKEHLRKAKYFKEKIERLRSKGITPL